MDNLNDINNDSTFHRFTAENKKYEFQMRERIIAKQIKSLPADSLVVIWSCCAIWASKENKMIYKNSVDFFQKHHEGQDDDRNDFKDFSDKQSSASVPTVYESVTTPTAVNWNAEDRYVAIGPWKELYSFDDMDSPFCPIEYDLLCLYLARLSDGLLHELGIDMKKETVI